MSKDIFRFWDYLGHKQPMLLQVFKPDENGVKQKGILTQEFVPNKERLKEIIEQWNGKGIIALGVNERPKGKMKAQDIERINCIVVDVDVRKELREKNGFVSSAEHKQHAFEKAKEMVQFLKKRFGLNPDLLVDSGNGYNLYTKVLIDLPKEKKWQETKTYRRICLIEEALRKKFNDGIVVLDCISKDCARRMKIPGTINKKDEAQAEDREAKIVEVFLPIKEKENTEAFNRIEIPKEVLSPKKTEGIIGKKASKTIQELLNSKDSKLLDLLEGNWKKHGYQSRSEGEIALCIKLIMKGATKEQVFQIMQEHNRIGKWQEKPESYKELTFQKALEETKKYAVEEGKEEPYYGIERFRYKTKVDIKRKIGLAYSKKVVNQAIQVEPHYSIYEFQFGSGLNKKFFLFSSPFKNYNLGENEIALRKLTALQGKKGTIDKTIEFLSEYWPEKRLLLLICKEHNIPTTEGEGKDKRNLEIGEIIENIAERQQKSPFLFTETPGVPLEELSKLRQEDWQAILKDYLSEGYEKDAIIELAYKSDLVEPNPELIRPKLFQPYNSNEMIYTNSKTGKTTLGSKTGVPVEEATPANLLGFSTAQEKVEGSLNNQTKSLNIDEMQEKKPEAYAGLSTYMETGETEVRKGKAKVNVKGYAGLRFQGNPKLSIESEEKILEGQQTLEESEFFLFQRFSDCLGIISRNNQAFGGRISFFVFRTDLKPAKRKRKISLKTLEKNQAIVETIFSLIMDDYTKLYFNEGVLGWLNKGFSESYVLALKRIEAKAQLQAIREFIEGHRALAHRHLRGKALKLAVVDRALDFLNGTLDIKELLGLASEYQKEIEEVNLSSFSGLVDVASKTETMKEYLKAEFRELPLNLKIVLEAFKEYCEKTESQECLLGTLKEVMQTPDNFSKPQVLRRTTKNIMHTNKKLKKFGVQVSGTSEEAKIYLENTEAFKLIWEAEE